MEISEPFKLEGYGCGQGKVWTVGNSNCYTYTFFLNVSGVDRVGGRFRETTGLCTSKLHVCNVTSESMQ